MTSPFFTGLAAGPRQPRSGAVPAEIACDYDLFLVCRIQEEYQATGDNRGSVAIGLQRTALIIDATLIRLVLVPALMQIMGRWNWWLPWIRPRSAAVSGISLPSMRLGHSARERRPRLGWRGSVAHPAHAARDSVIEKPGTPPVVTEVSAVCPGDSETY
ncbi:hypothetical protein [Nocardia brasiliensis]|uniref:hypothetical protein n=1 Tax=Nocardia brasiliensis TaxID=37326 RepID=UPI00366E7508